MIEIELEKENMSEENENLKIIASSGISNKYDRYSQIPHMSYEFIIPIELIGRDNVYDFFVQVYDGDLEQTYSWPKGIEEKHPSIPSTDNWGKMVSPDKTIPEFGIPMTILMITITSIIISTKIFRNIRMI